MVVLRGGPVIVAGRSFDVPATSSRLAVPYMFEQDGRLRTATAYYDHDGEFIDEVVDPYEPPEVWGGRMAGWFDDGGRTTHG